MLFKWLTGASVLAVASVAAQAASLEEDARAFGTRDQIHDVVISPSGSKLAMIASGPGSETVLQLADLATGQTLNLTKSDGKPQSLRNCEFAGETQLVCSHSGIEPYDKYLVNFSGQFTITTDGRTMKPLRQKAQFEQEWVNTSDGSVIDWLPGEEGRVLMSRSHVPDINTTGSILGRNQRGLGVDRVELSTMKSSSAEPARSNASGYMTDGRGNVRLMMLSDEDRSDQVTGLTPIRYRTKGSRDWRELGTYNSVTNEGWYPLAIDADADSLYALKKTAGRDALYRVKLDGSLASTLIGSDPRVDIDGIVRLGAGQRVIGYHYATEHRQVVYFDPEFSRLRSALSKAIPAQPAISFVSASSDGQKIVVLASSDDNAGTFYRFDKATKQLAEIAPLRPSLVGRQLAKMRPITVAAADGVRIPAYLTLPPGSDGKNLPTVVLPHGGPASRDEWGFDWLPQFLAARGYAVIQPNYRGSAGFGSEWLAQNGFRSWKTSIGDISAAAHDLVKQGIADPKRLAIVGWSYGGYAALQSAAVEPKLYRAAVGIAPVTDLAMLKSEAADFSNEKLIADYIGSGPHLVEGSPLQNVSAIEVPVLLFHGDRDANVGIAQSSKMETALRSAGKPVEFVQFANLDHQIDDSNARMKMLLKIGSFLDQAIGR